MEATKKTANKGPKEDTREMFALSGTDSDSDLELPTVSKPKKKKTKKVKKAKEVSDSDVQDSDEEAAAVGAWGSRKKHFYGGNSGYQDDEVDDSDMEEDNVEQREVEMLQARQLEAMDEEDFLDTFAAADKKPKAQKGSKKQDATVAEEAVKRDLSQMSRKELLALFRQAAPEFDGIVADFADKMEHAVEKLLPVVKLCEAGKLPQGPVPDYVRAKYQLLLNYSVNILCYLMLRAEGANLKLHPVTSRLVQYR